MFRFGLIINPYAGLGGPAAMKGSDHLSASLKLKACSRALERAERCLRMLLAWRDRVTVMGFDGAMGGALCQRLGLAFESLGQASSEPSTAADSQRLAAMLRQQQPDLVLFVGGDGTARDIASHLGEHCPCLGIPAGVKMHSGVYAVVPEAAGEVLQNFLQGQLIGLSSQEVRDIDEQAFRQGQVRSRHFADLLVPDAEDFIQGVKSSGVVQEPAQLDALVDGLLEDWDHDALYLLGPGSTTAALLEAQKLPATLLGVDAVYAGQVVGRDLDSEQLDVLLADYRARDVEVRLIVTAIGGQGHIFGRGNQQFSPRLLRALGREAIEVIVTENKLRELQGKPLLLDTNDAELDRLWAGRWPLRVGYQHRVYYPVGRSSEQGEERE